LHEAGQLGAPGELRQEKSLRRPTQERLPELRHHLDLATHVELRQERSDGRIEQAAEHLELLGFGHAFDAQQDLFASPGEVVEHVTREVHRHLGAARLNGVEQLLVGSVPPLLELELAGGERLMKGDHHLCARRHVSSAHDLVDPSL
jgi:hypothetical protein